VVTLKGLSKTRERTLIVGELVGPEEEGLEEGMAVG
jgi:hypothetical protein